uniref:Nuclear pore complex protein Nup85 n=1 Tax=Steinernema glaseri TaxID=37863 RepID=A0A1I7Y5M2_9BILA
MSFTQIFFMCVTSDHLALMDIHNETPIQSQENEIGHCKTKEGRRVLQLATKKGVVGSADVRKKHAEPLSNPAYVKLVNESHSVFTRLHGAINASMGRNDAEYLSSLDQASREYRAVLRSAIVTVTHSSTERDRELLLCLRGREMLWGLIELVAFCDHDEEIAFHLSKWARMMLSSEASDVYAQVITSDKGSRSSERNALYWNGVLLQVLSCNFGTATTMLHSHTDAQADQAVGKMVIILERINRLFTEGYSCVQFVKIQETLRNLLKERYFAENSNVEFIARLLSGETNAFAEVCGGLIDYWCEIVPLFTITQVPNAILSDLSDCAQTCFEFNTAKNNRQLDLTLRAAMSGNVKEALLSAANCFGDWWFSGHLSDLIFLAKPVVLFEDDANLRDVFLLEYSYVLLGDEQLWRSGVDYLTDVCSGFDLLEEFILQDPVQNTKKGVQLISICNKWDLKEGHRSVTRKLAEISLSKGELANALVWANRNGDSCLISEVVNKILRKSPEDIMIIGNYVKITEDLAFSSPELVFLKEYYEYLILAQKSKTNDSLERLTSIFKKGLVPPFMYVPLLECLIKCIEERDVKINKFAQPIVECVQKIKIEIARAHYTLERCSEVEKKLKILNNALAGPLLHKNLFNKKL